ncbi:MAG: beta-ketoacyl-ACP reductase [Raineya sp.]|nr:beta-ketoacyl-ACP reductase [Raineya sp.]
MRLKDKVAVVTGGAKGIGRAILAKLLQEGAKGVIWDINPLAEKTAQELNGTPEKIVKAFTGVDVSQLESVQKACEATLKEFGRIDILVNNAGIIRDNSLRKMTAEEWQSVIDVNLTGVFNCTRVVAPTMIEQKYGKIVSISSIVGFTGNFGQSNYVASKAAIIGLTKTWARELGKYQINVNAIAPGVIDTDMFATVKEEYRQEFIRRIPVGRIGKPEDIANACAFLVSDEANFITGQTLIVDGGGTLG